MTPHALAIQTVDADRSAAIAEDYRRGMNLLVLLANHGIGNETLSRALRLHNVPRRGRGQPAWDVGADPVTPQVVALRRAGATHGHICDELQIGRHRCARIIQATGVRPNEQRSAEARSWRAKRARDGEALDRLAALPASKWDEWRKAGAALRSMADEVGVARSAIASFARRHDIALPVYARKPSPRQQSRSAIRSMAPNAPAAVEKGPAWTWFDYVEVTGREFATPHHLRQGPRIKAWLEANGVKP